MTFMTGEEFTPRELEEYKKIAVFRKDITNFKKTFNLLDQYVATIDDLDTLR